MDNRPSSLFFDPNTGDDMVDKDDLFQEEEGSNPQGSDRGEPSPDEDDDIIELSDIVEIPSEDIEEDVIELMDMVEASDDGIIELTEEAKEPVADDDVLDLTEVVADEDELEDDVLELTDIVAADDTEDDENLDLSEKAEASDVDDDIIDLTEPVAEDEVIELLDTVEMPFKEMVEDSVETADFPWEPDPDTGADTTDLTEHVAENEAADLSDTIEVPDQDIGEDNIEAADITFETDSDTGDDMGDIDMDEAAMDLTETVEDMEPDQEERFRETIELPTAGYEEDKELLELIDDIQATLNDEPVADHVSDQEGAPQTDDAMMVETHDKEAEAYTFLDSDEVIEDGEVPETETEFVDHLGIDLASDMERKTLENSQEAVLADAEQTENIESGIDPDTLETAVKQALTDMLADDNNPLTKAIENAVKKALGQGTDT
jgi:hypothetical protein